MEMENNEIVGKSLSIIVRDFELDPIAIKVAVKAIDNVLKKGIVQDSNETMKTREHENSSENITKEEIA